MCQAYACSSRHRQHSTRGEVAMRTLKEIREADERLRDALELDAIFGLAMADDEDTVPTDEELEKLFGENS